MSEPMQRLQQAREDRRRAEAELVNAILDTHKMGHNVSTIAIVAGLSRTTVYKIIEEHAS